MLKEIKNYIKNKIDIADQIARSKSVDVIESEIVQLEYVFSTLAFGQFIGIPSLPSSVMFELLPESEKSINLLMNRMSTNQEPLSELVSIFRID